MEKSEIQIAGEFWRADSLLNKGEIEEGVKLLHEIVSENPEYGRAHNHLGWFYETKIQDYKKAEYHYKLSLKFSPDYPSVYFNYAVFLRITAKSDELITFIQEAVKVPGVNVAGLYNELGIMHENQGNWTEAIAAYQEFYKFSTDEKKLEEAKNCIERCQRKSDYTAYTRQASR